SVAVGDQVLWEPCGDDQGRVVAVLPRRSELLRPAHGGKTRLVAANLDQVLVVMAPEPEPDFLLADQILAVCEHRDIGAVLLFNKIDLFDGDAEVESQLQGYAAIGYPLLRVSVKQGAGMSELQAALAGKTSMLAGQSGVGKSSISRALLPEHDIRVGHISALSGLGRHTTTAATLYHLAAGGDLIDSPGVAVFGMADMTPAILAQNYRDFQPFLPRCRYNDCAHIKDQAAPCARRWKKGKSAIAATGAI
ncbi:ribosome small subunit-dependent GTPase A, partial [Methylogaea oryzae]|uniref:ribosome small subunit-dependent GTPase A n=1 Tax=Methylogaea oryzae TaxID=1295382 RepID=UPI0006D13419